MPQTIDTGITYCGIPILLQLRDETPDPEYWRDDFRSFMQKHSVNRLIGCTLPLDFKAHQVILDPTRDA